MVPVTEMFSLCNLWKLFKDVFKLNVSVLPPWRVCLTAGGFKGCGHGHKGHPGKPHWSCCGSTKEKSECLPQSVLAAVSPRSHLRTVELWGNAEPRSVEVMQADKRRQQPTGYSCGEVTLRLSVQISAQLEKVTRGKWKWRLNEWGRTGVPACGSPLPHCVLMASLNVMRLTRKTDNKVGP